MNGEQVGGYSPEQPNSASLREANEHLRQTNPELFENIRKEEEAKERLARTFVERIQAADLTPHEFQDLLESARVHKLVLNKPINDWNPEIVTSFGQPRIIPSKVDNSRGGFKPTTLKLGLEMAQQSQEDQDNDVVTVPYLSFAAPTTPQEKIAGAKVTQVAWNQFTTKQYHELSRLVRDPRLHELK